MEVASTSGRVSLAPSEIAYARRVSSLFSRFNCGTTAEQCKGPTATGRRCHSRRPHHPCPSHPHRCRHASAPAAVAPRAAGAGPSIPPAWFPPTQLSPQQPAAAPRPASHGEGGDTHLDTAGPRLEPQWLQPRPLAAPSGYQQRNAAAQPIGAQQLQPQPGPGPQPGHQPGTLAAAVPPRRNAVSQAALTQQVLSCTTWLEVEALYRSLQAAAAASFTSSAPASTASTSITAAAAAAAAAVAPSPAHPWSSLSSASPPSSSSLRFPSAAAPAVAQASDAGAAPAAASPSPSSPLGGPQLVALVTHLARLPRHRSYAKFEDDRLQRFGCELAEALLPHLREMDQPQLCALLWAYGKLDCHPGEAFMAAALPALQRQLPACSPTGLSEVVWGLGRVGHVPPAAFLERFYEAAAAALNRRRANPQHVSNLLWGCVMLRLQPPEGLLSRGVRLLREKVQEASPQALALTCWAVVQLSPQLPDPSWWALVEETSLGMRDRLQPQDVSHLVWSMARAGYSPPYSWLHLMCCESYTFMRGFRPQELSNLLWGIVVSGYRPSTSWTSAAIAEAQRLLPSFKAFELAVLLWSLASLEAGPLLPRTFWGALFFHSAPKLGYFSAQDCSNVLWSMARMGTRPPEPWMAAFVEESFTQLPRFEPQHFANTLWAFAKLGRRPPEPWMERFFLESRPLLLSFKACEVAMTLMAVGISRASPPRQWIDQMLLASYSKLASCRGQELANILWALGRIRFNPRQPWLDAAAATAARLAAKGSLSYRDLATVDRALTGFGAPVPPEVTAALAAAVALHPEGEGLEGVLDPGPDLKSGSNSSSASYLNPGAGATAGVRDAGAGAEVADPPVVLEPLSGSESGRPGWVEVSRAKAPSSAAAAVGTGTALTPTPTAGALQGRTSPPGGPAHQARAGGVSSDPPQPPGQPPQPPPRQRQAPEGQRQAPEGQGQAPGQQQLQGQSDAHEAWRNSSGTGRARGWRAAGGNEASWGAAAEGSARVSREAEERGQQGGVHHDRAQSQVRARQQGGRQERHQGWRRQQPPQEGGSIPWAEAAAAAAAMETPAAVVVGQVDAGDDCSAGAAQPVGATGAAVAAAAAAAVQGLGPESPRTLPTPEPRVHSRPPALGVLAREPPSSSRGQQEDAKVPPPPPPRPRPPLTNAASGSATSSGTGGTEGTHPLPPLSTPSAADGGGAAGLSAGRRLAGMKERAESAAVAEGPEAEAEAGAGVETEGAALGHAGMRSGEQRAAARRLARKRAFKGAVVSEPEA